jgi:hypothetical protein
MKKSIIFVLFVCLFLAMLFVTSVEADTNIYINASDSSWNTASNWSKNAVPVSTDTALFNSGSGTCIATTPVSVNAIIISTANSNRIIFDSGFTVTTCMRDSGSGTRGWKHGTCFLNGDHGYLYFGCSGTSGYDDAKNCMLKVDGIADTYELRNMEVQELVWYGMRLLKSHTKLTTIGQYVVLISDSIPLIAGDTVSIDNLTNFYLRPRNATVYLQYGIGSDPLFTTGYPVRFNNQCNNKSSTSIPKFTYAAPSWCYIMPNYSVGTAITQFTGNMDLGAGSTLYMNNYSGNDTVIVDFNGYNLKCANLVGGTYNNSNPYIIKYRSGTFDITNFSDGYNDYPYSSLFDISPWIISGDFTIGTNNHTACSPGNELKFIGASANTLRARSQPIGRVILNKSGGSLIVPDSLHALGFISKAGSVTFGYPVNCNGYKIADSNTTDSMVFNANIYLDTLILVSGSKIKFGAGCELYCKCNSVIVNNSGVSLPTIHYLDSCGPQISTQPQNIRKKIGETANFYIIATGSGTLHYIWKKNGSTIGGATDSSYTTPVIVPADTNAKFVCLVTDTKGTTVSDTAILSVCIPPLISSITPAQPGQTAMQTRGGLFKIHGSRFLNTQGTGKVKLGTSNLLTAKTWSDTLVEDTIPPTWSPRGTYNLIVITSDTLADTGGIRVLVPSIIIKNP